MTSTDIHRTQPQLPFLYEMAISFFMSARESLDPVLQDIDGYRDFATEPDGRPVAPDHVVQKFAQLPFEVVIHHVGACLSATTNLGLAYVHSFRLLSFLTRNKDALPPNAGKPNLVKLFDALSTESKNALTSIYGKVGSHDFEMELNTSPFLDDKTKDNPMPGGRDLRGILAYWQSNGMLQDSHISYLREEHETTMRIFIPLRSMLVLDGILADVVSPKLGQDYAAMNLNQQKSKRNEHPALKWDEGFIHESLPDKHGGELNAKWQPAVTSVVRIRELGSTSWSPGFETPFNQCSFVDLKADTEYEIQLTHKNDAGESEPVISTIRTDPRAH